MEMQFHLNENSKLSIVSENTSVARASMHVLKWSKGVSVVGVFGTVAKNVSSDNLPARTKHDPQHYYARVFMSSISACVCLQTYRSRWTCNPALFLLHFNSPHINFGLPERTKTESGVPGIDTNTYKINHTLRELYVHCFSYRRFYKWPRISLHTWVSWRQPALIA